jgi:hypothetical protein
MKFNIPINPNAPVVEENNIWINVAPQKVWMVLTQINQWPNWQKAVTFAQLYGLPETGVDFTWKASGLTFTSNIHTAVAYSHFGWTGKTIGASAIHNWQLQAEQNGTRVTVSECLDGLLPRFLKKMFKQQLKVGMLKSLQELKAASEN